MEVHIRIIGALLIALSLVHVGFPKRFNWDSELALLSLLNRQMMKIHTLFIAIMVLLMGLLCLLHSEELVGTELGKSVSLGFGIFWAIRLYIQLFGYSSELWKGKRFETSVHVVFTAIWMYLSAVFILNYVN